TVTFGAMDAPLTGKDLDESGLAQFPMVMGGIVPVLNVEGLLPGDLVLDGATLAKIFLGEVETGNDPAIQTLNAGVKGRTELSPSCIAPMARAQPITSRTICPRSVPTGGPRSAPTPPSNGPAVSGPRGTRALPTTSHRPRVRSATLSMPTPNRTNSSMPR